MEHILLSHVTSNANSREAALAFFETESLIAFHTSLVLPGWLRALASGKRFFLPQLRPFLNSHPFWELLRLFCRKFSRLQPLVERMPWGTIEQVTRNFDLAVARAVLKSSDACLVYAYMDAAEQTFLAARQRGIRTIYELPTPYWRFTHGMVVAEAEYQPEWAMTLPVMDENSEAMQRRDSELQLADLVIVPSDLVRDSLRLAPPFQAQVHVVPYGCPELKEAEVESLRFHVSSLKPARLRVLYVGSLNQGKGLSYLAEAMTGLENLATLTVIGSRTSAAPCAALDRLLAIHRHRSGLSHDEVLAEMRQHDVLVLPTLYEGLALVLLEAMACGLTVITTPHSGIAGLIEDGQEGLLVPIRSATAIHERLRQLAGNAELLQTMRQASLTWSRDHSWQRYREQLRSVVVL
jgi:starch synthase